MRIAILSAALAATLFGTMPVQAQSAPYRSGQDYRDDARPYRRHDDDRRGGGIDRDPRRDDVRADRFGRGQDFRRFRGYDYNRPEPGQRAYYADRYYRDGRYYQARRLGRNDRIYRGENGRYYCRRNDGTTGLIIGGLAGGALGNVVANGRSSLLGTLIGAGGGALLGQSIDRGNVQCR